MEWGGGSSVEGSKPYNTKQGAEDWEPEQSFTFLLHFYLSRGKTREWKERQGREKIRRGPPHKTKKNVHLYIQANTFTSNKKPSNGKMYTAHAEKKKKLFREKRF